MYPSFSILIHPSFSLHVTLFCLHVHAQLILYDIKQKLGKKVGRFAKVGSLVAPGLSHAYVSVDDTGRVVNCDSMKDNLVIHCSHASTDEAYQKGLFPIADLETFKEAMERRSEAALIFLDDFEAQCKPNI